jgi:tyrosyl-tRNA synthetase
MDAKKRLALTITASFHGDDAAARAAENWAKQFQQREIPEDLEEVRVSSAAIGTRLDKLLVAAALASSGTEATRLIKAGSVQVNGVVQKDPHLALDAAPTRLTLRVGRRAKIAIIE